APRPTSPRRAAARPTSTPGRRRSAWRCRGSRKRRHLRPWSRPPASDRLHRAIVLAFERRLAGAAYLAGGAYTIADIAVFPWYGGLAKGRNYGAAEFRSVQDYKHVQRWADAILARPAVKRGRMVNRTSGAPAEQLRERHDASDFATKTQDKIA